MVPDNLSNKKKEEYKKPGDYSLMTFKLIQVSM